jgi:hypothetical protein
MGFACRAYANRSMELVIFKDTFFTVKCFSFRAMDAVDAIVFIEA